MTRILIADDSTHAQRMGSNILSEEGFEVTTVGNGQAALQSLDSVLPDLVVADVFMPGRDGYEVCRYIKSDPNFAHIPVLLIIGAMEPYDPEEGKKAGADGLITKPLESSNLLATVRELLEAAKRFTPGKAQADATVAEQPAEKLAEEVVDEFPEENPDWAIEDIKTPVEEKFDVPAEMSQQAVGMLTDLLEPSESPEPEPAPVMMHEEMPEPAEASTEFPAELLEFNPEAPIEPEAEAAPMLDQESLMETMEESVRVMESAGPSPAGLSPAGPSEDVLAAEPLMDPDLQTDTSQQAAWTAEPAALTADEEKLFEEATATWGDLEQIVAETSTETSGLSPLPSPVEPDTDQAYGDDERDPDLITDSASMQVDETPNEDLEVYDNLSEASGAPDPKQLVGSTTVPEISSLAAEPDTDQAGVEAPLAEISESITATQDQPDEPVPSEGALDEVAESPEEPEPLIAAEDSRDAEDSRSDTETRPVDPVAIEKAVRNAMETIIPKIVERVKDSFKN